MIQTARNLVMDLEDNSCQVKYLIRDRDGKYPALIDQVLADTGIDVVLSGVRIPRMNSIMERWIQAEGRIRRKLGGEAVCAPSNGGPCNPRGRPPTSLRN